MVRVVIQIRFIFFTIALSTSQVSSWSLQRPDHSQVLFHNTTITGDQTYCNWMWMDSNKGVWDVSIRIWLSTSQTVRLRSGYFTYQDTLGGNLLRVSWTQSIRQGLTWRQYSTTALPSVWWNLTADFGQLGYQGNSAQFHVNGELIKLKPASRIVPPILSLYDGMMPSGRRIKREPSHMERQRKRFDILDLFTGNGIFASLPQLFINIFSFFANLFPSQDDGDSGAVVEATEPDAEIVPQSTITTASTTSTEEATQTTKMTQTEQDMMTQEPSKISRELETMTEASEATPKSSAARLQAN